MCYRNLYIRDLSRAQAKGNDKKKKQEDQYKVKPPKNGEVVGDGKPNSKGYVPFSQGGQQWAFNTKTGEKIKLDTTLDPEGFTAKTGISQIVLTLGTT